MARPKIKPKDITKLDSVANPLINDNFIIKAHLRTDHQFKNNKGKSPQITYEDEQATKVYVNAEHRKVIASLNPGAKSLFIHILYELDWGKDYIWINKARFMDENNMLDERTFNAAIEELCNRPEPEQPIITPSTLNGVYWINPRLFFCGSRLDKYPKNVDIK